MNDQPLTQRERKIILICQILLNPVTKDKPFDHKVQLFRQALRAKNISFNEPEITAIIDSITQEGRDTIGSIIPKLKEFGFDLSWLGLQ